MKAIELNEMTEVVGGTNPCLVIAGIPILIGSGPFSPFPFQGEDSPMFDCISE